MRSVSVCYAVSGGRCTVTVLRSAISTSVPPAAAAALLPPAPPIAAEDDKPPPAAVLTAAAEFNLSAITPMAMRMAAPPTLPTTTPAISPSLNSDEADDEEELIFGSTNTVESLNAPVLLPLPVLTISADSPCAVLVVLLVPVSVSV